MTTKYIKTYLESLKSSLDLLDPKQLLTAWNLLDQVQDHGGTVWICGNGGSASLAEHLAQDLTKQCHIKAQSLTNTSMLTALANDVAYAEIFAEQLGFYALTGDLLVVISGSGNSPNILRALSKARSLALPSLALLGFTGGKVLSKGLADHHILIPSAHMGRSEDGHLIVSHILTYGLMEGRI